MTPQAGQPVLSAGNVETLIAQRISQILVAEVNDESVLGHFVSRERLRCRTDDPSVDLLVRWRESDLPSRNLREG
jgi:hypothetical protein